LGIKGLFSGAFRIVPFVKWLIAMVSKRVSLGIHGLYPALTSHSLSGVILQVASYFLKAGYIKKISIPVWEASEISKMFSMLMFDSAKWLAFETLGDYISLKLTKFQPLKIGQNHPILGVMKHRLRTESSFRGAVSCRDGTYLVVKVKNPNVDCFFSWSEMTE